MVRGDRRIRVGIPKKVLLAAALDPRIKRSGGIIAGIPEVDGAKVWDALFVEAEKVFETLNANVQAVLPDAAADGAARKKRRMNSVLDDSDDIFSLFQVQAPVVAVRSDASVTVSDEIERYKCRKIDELRAYTHLKAYPRK